MNTAHTIVTVLAAAWIGFSAYATFTKAPWVVDNLADYGIPASSWPWLGAAKATGAIGLLIGLANPTIGRAATAGVVLYFLGALVAVVRARAFRHVAYPLMYLAPVILAATLGAGS